MKLPTLNTQILLGAFFGIVIGLGLLALGKTAPITQSSLYVANLLGTLFIDLLKMVLVPLVFTSIVVGVANLQAHKQIHRVWITTLGFFIFSMAIAIVLGLLANVIFHPGQGLHLDMFQQAMSNVETKQQSLGDFFAQFLHGLFMNPVAALAQGNILAVVVFALFMGIALVIGGERYRNILVLLQELLEIIMQMVSWIMRIAPVGIMALLVKMIVSQELALLSSLSTFIVVVMGALLVHGVIMLPLILYLVTGMKPLYFWRGAREALVTAFATCSSSATVPITLRCVEHNLHVRKEIAQFVVPLGATINMNGTALYEAAAALFVANLVGIELNLLQQLIVFLTALFAAIGAPGIPSAGMVTMVMVLQSVGLPAEAIAILLPIDRLIDTLRTAVNVEDDIVGSLVVQKLVKAHPK
ncbi:MAG: dicarboxylate/amino acid:cation symporter, partial [Methylococcaceae bacterium]|nr:dicarboxylate/amino acid:cation symporter [Methylococcaceae bacterium]